MSAAKKFIPSYTVEDYQQWEGDWELWNGIPVSMSPSPFGNHQATLTNLLLEIGNAIRANQCAAKVLAEMDWIVAADSVVRPDLSVVCGPAPERHVESPPSMVSEILSPSTQERDQTFKRDLYEQQGVATYLILDPNNQTVVQYTLQTNGKYEQQPEADELIFLVCDDCKINVDRRNLFE